MTDAFCDMKKIDFNQLKYVQAMDKVNGESDWDKELWDVKRVIRHRGRPGKTRFSASSRMPTRVRCG